MNDSYFVVSSPIKRVMTTINHNGYETVVNNSLMCNASPVFRSKYYNHTEVIIEDNCSQQVFDVFLALCQGKSGVILENYQGILLQLSQKWGCNFEKYIAFSSKIFEFNNEPNSIVFLSIFSE